MIHDKQVNESYFSTFNCFFIRYVILTFRPSEHCKPVFLKLGSEKGCQGFRETKTRNDGRVLLAVQNLHVQGDSNMTGTNCDLFTHKSSWSYLNHLV
jgi:phosphatidylserine decarboxylase